MTSYPQLPLFDLQVTNVTEFEAMLQYAMAHGTLTPAYPEPRIIAIG